jgi:hypothetical protein
MNRFRSFSSALLLAVLTSACAAQRPAAPMLMAAVSGDDAVVVTAFRALLNDVIGDSADRVCVSIARTSSDGALEDADPNESVLRALRGGAATVLPRSACAADERNFGNPRGLLRLRDVAPVDEHTLIVHAEAIGEHSARYECLVPRGQRAAPHARCRITDRDWPGSQSRS